MKNLRTASVESNFTGSYRVHCNLHYYKRLVPKFVNISVQLFQEMTINTAT